MHAGVGLYYGEDIYGVPPVVLQFVSRTPVLYEVRRRASWAQQSALPAAACMPQPAVTKPSLRLHVSRMLTCACMHQGAHASAIHSCRLVLTALVCVSHNVGEHLRDHPLCAHPGGPGG
jgi:hypothetical protein